MGTAEKKVGDKSMIEKKYASADEMILKVQESKEEYEKKYLTMSFMDKLRVLVRLQKKAYLMGQLKVKPWPIEEEKRPQAK
jgi:hypothetical protein